MTGAPSLLMTSRRGCVRILKRIKDVGLARYDLLRPILQKIENPYHLHELEQNSPHLKESDSELWLEFIKRDVPFWAEIDLPDRPDYEVYCSLRQQVNSEVDEDAERMKQALLGLDKQKERNSSKFVDLGKPGLPKQKPTDRQKFAAYDRRMGGIAPTFVLNTPKEGSKGLTPYDHGERWKIQRPKIRPKNPPPRKSGLPGAVKRNDRLSVPTHRLNNSAAPGVVKAPRSFIEDYRVQKSNAKPPPPRNTSSSAASQQKATTSSNIRRETKYPSPPRKSQSTPTKQASQPLLSSKPVKSTATSQTPKAPSTSTHPSGTGPNEHPSGRDTPQTGDSQSPGSSPPRPSPAKRPVPPPRPAKRPAESALLKPKRARVT